MIPGWRGVWPVGQRRGKEGRSARETVGERMSRRDAARSTVSQRRTADDPRNQQRQELPPDSGPKPGTDGPQRGVRTAAPTLPIGIWSGAVNHVPPARQNRCDRQNQIRPRRCRHRRALPQHKALSIDRTERNTLS